MRARILSLIFLGLIGSHLASAADTLNPGDSIFAPAPELILPPSILMSDIVDFTAGGVNGKLGVYVLGDFSANPYHGLTFVYELKNVGSSASDGLTSLELGGWAGLNVAVTQRDTLYFSPSSSPVLPLDFNRSPGSGSTIKIGFPPDVNAPPIFSGESSYGLVIFTNATSWTTTSASITSANFDTTVESSATVQTITASSSVPDSGSTVGLLTFGIIVICSIRKRSARG